LQQILTFRLEQNSAQIPAVMSGMDCLMSNSQHLQRWGRSLIVAPQSIQINVVVRWCSVKWYIKRLSSLLSLHYGEQILLSEETVKHFVEWKVGVAS